MSPYTHCLAFALLVLGFSTLSGQEPPVAQPPNPPAEASRVVVPLLDAEKQVEDAGYRIGISAHATEKGLHVDAVMPESPAAKAGLQTGDILLSVGDEKVSELGQVAKAVAGSQGKELNFQIQRGDKLENIAVTPEKQPANPPVVIVAEAGDDEEQEKKEQLAQRGEKKSAAFRWQWPGGQKMSGPAGIIYRPQPSQPGAPPPAGQGFSGGQGFGRFGFGAMPTMPLPDDMEVTISKKGNDKCIVTAKQGDKLWRTSENELEMLPPPAQIYAARLLGKAGPGGGFGWGAGMTPPGGPLPKPMPGAPVGQNPPSSPWNVRQLPGGGIRIEIPEGQETPPGAAAQPKDKPQKKPGRRLERKRVAPESSEAKQPSTPPPADPSGGASDAKPAAGSAQEEAVEQALKEQLELLQRELRELREEALKDEGTK